MNRIANVLASRRSARRLLLLATIFLAATVPIELAAQCINKDDAKFWKFVNVPAVLAPGQTADIEIWMNNVGSRGIGCPTLWRPEYGYRLGSQNPDATTTWGPATNYIATSTTVEGENLQVFRVRIKAPDIPGTYNLQYRMAQIGKYRNCFACGGCETVPADEPVMWFGERTPNVQILVRAENFRYVAIGDSYSAGEGVGSWMSGPLDGDEYCSRSFKAYPQLVTFPASTLNRVFGACANAKIEEVFLANQTFDDGAVVVPKQQTHLPGDLITFTFGGNNIRVAVPVKDSTGKIIEGQRGFSRVLKDCAFDECAGKSEKWDTYWKNIFQYLKGEGAFAGEYGLPHELGVFYSSIRKRVGDATVVALGYPWMFPDKESEQLCAPLALNYSVAEQKRFREAARLLNESIQIAAARADFLFIDAQKAFEGHLICDGATSGTRFAASEWIDYISPDATKFPPIADRSFHPNACGQAAYASALRATLLSPNDTTDFETPDCDAGTYAKIRDLYASRFYDDLGLIGGILRGGQKLWNWIGRDRDVVFSEPPDMAALSANAADRALQPQGWLTVPLALSNGDGTFIVKDPFVGEFGTMATVPNVRVLKGDFNGDGKSDLALNGGAGWTTQPLALSNGDGTFTIHNKPITNFGSWSANGTPYVGDYNADGKSDIALLPKPGVSWNTLPVALSSGDGTFIVSNSYVGAFSSSWSTTANVRALPGDFNGDGKTDIALNGGTGWTRQPVAMSKGDGSFTIYNLAITNFATWSENAYAYLGDFNGDKKSDIALINKPGVAWTTVPVALSIGDGTFAVQNRPVGDFALWARVANVRVLPGDFNGDGKTDLALNGGSGWTTQPLALSTSTAFYVYNYAIANFGAWSATSNVRALTGDFNLDGRSDIALTGGAGWTTQPLALSNGNGTFSVLNQPITDFASWAAMSQTQSIAGDFDGGGRTDIALVSRAAVSVGNPATDADDKPDLLWRHADGWISIWGMDGTTQIASAGLPRVSDANWKIVGVGDFNSDGQADIVWRNYSTGSNSVWLMKGTTVAAQVVLPLISDVNWQIGGVDDFDGDGHYDIVWHHITNASLHIWKMNGTSYVSSYVLPNTDTTWRLKGTGDFNSDGHPDLVWRHESGRIAFFMLKKTKYDFSVAPLELDLPQFFDLGAIVDLNRDGSLDLIMRDYRNGFGDNYVLYMNQTELSTWDKLRPVDDTNWSLVGPR